ncbi:EpsG family protein [Paenibacillus sp. FSL H8-0259]|uniref:EpsG family protein n=1 Tax=Paenibacillus sp. FSL H8-0259 TaxID=1920423 RepID=UPI00096D5590|nr:EpsG family protein [Paenibacillus sp. FSL H8-0259]OMF21227.1 hypothetical protein BK132_33750 [Paenibacillus sp. FSL H8-0259]
MQYFIAGILAVLGLKVKKSKILFVVLFSFMWMLFGWNTWNADYYGYQQTYYSIGSYNIFYEYFEQFEIGYRYFSRFLFSLGVDYDTFLIVYSLIGLLLIGSTIIKFTSKPGYVLALYFIYPFLMDIVQIRNFMAMALIIYGVRYLFSSKKVDLIKYVFFVFLAASFQSAGLFYLILLFAKMKSVKKLVNWVTLITAFLVFMLFLMKSGYSVPFLGSVSYFSTKTSIITRIGYFFYFIIGFQLVRFSYEKIKDNIHEKELNNLSTQKDHTIIKMADVIYKVNIIILSVYPLLFFSVDFIRLYRNILPISYILFSIAVSQSRNKKMTIFKIVTIVFVFFSEWLFAYYMSGSDVFYPIFEQNRIMNFLN